MKTKEMNGAKKFISWLLDRGYLEQDDLLTDEKEIVEDMKKIKKVAPKFYNMLMCMCDYI